LADEKVEEEEALLLVVDVDFGRELEGEGKGRGQHDGIPSLPSFFLSLLYKLERLTL